VSRDARGLYAVLAVPRDDSFASAAIRSANASFLRHTAVH